MVYEELKGEATAAQKAINDCFPGTIGLRDSKDESELTEQQKALPENPRLEIQAIMSDAYIYSSIDNNGLAEVKSQIMTTFPGHMWHIPCECHQITLADQDPNVIWPSIDPSHYHKNNTIYCGVELLRLRLSMENLGIHYANVEVNLIVMCHLYNLAKQTGRLKASWLALEKVMEAHVKDLFFGSVPSRPEDFLKRFQVMMGLSITSLAKNARAKTVKDNKSVKVKM